MPDLDTRLDIHLPGILVGLETTGAYFIYPRGLPSKPLVYSGGLGNQIDFEARMIRDYKARIVGFDPTDTCARFLRRYRPDRFEFFHAGLSDKDGEQEFSLNKKPSAYYTSVSLGSTDKGEASAEQTLKFATVRIPSVMRQLGHDKIDLLKIDIEGAEYGVIDDLLACDILPNQLALEWHFTYIGEGDRSKGIEITNEYMERLRDRGYLLCFVGHKASEMTFVHKDSLDS
ncbi:FkbM family methyltransferase [Parasphingopyxis algicola]|uniref:FkbM family methyltransferase n=1 Tax=Parasphingopyxis algicola TaxID=2026624 RepID=UPI0015A29CE4|nr:FkbM family methyltransferase [Parasphingopyxis algicola]QLC26651.1 FkbM family methyltransferase [Parasphingopyxis algicola]